MNQVKEYHERRMAKLKSLIEERRKVIEDHDSGRRLLREEEYNHASKQFNNFNRKLEQMKELNTQVS